MTCKNSREGPNPQSGNFTHVRSSAIHIHRAFRLFFPRDVDPAPRAISLLRASLFRGFPTSGPRVFFLWRLRARAKHFSRGEEEEGEKENLVRISNAPREKDEGLERGEQSGWAFNFIPLSGFYDNRERERGKRAFIIILDLRQEIVLQFFYFIEFKS